jgi:glycerol-1-phosphate dehydrogenase [NAD(P)+]
VLDDLVTVFRRHGLPITPGELGIDPQQFADAVVYGPATRPDRFTVLEHLGLDVRSTLAAYDDYLERVSS